MYTIENNLLHLHLGCHPNRDFCHHNRDSKIPIGVADFSNEFHQKLNQITVKRGGRARAAAHISRLRWQNFKYSLFLPLSLIIISVVFLRWIKRCHSVRKKTTKIIICDISDRSLYLKFCHFNRDVRAPAPASPPHFTVICFNF